MLTLRLSHRKVMQLLLQKRLRQQRLLKRKPARHPQTLRKLRQKSLPSLKPSKRKPPRKGSPSLKPLKQKPPLLKLRTKQPQKMRKSPPPSRWTNP